MAKQVPAKPTFVGMLTRPTAAMTRLMASPNWPNGWSQSPISGLARSTKPPVTVRLGRVPSVRIDRLESGALAEGEPRIGIVCLGQGARRALDDFLREFGIGLV